MRKLPVLLMILLMTAFFVTSCGGGGSSSNSGTPNDDGDGGGNEEPIDASQYYYLGQPGDSFTYTVEEELDGEPYQTYIEVSAFTGETDIEAKYLYTGILVCSSLETTSNNMVDPNIMNPVGKTFYTAEGEEIIDDDLKDLFTNVQYSEVTGTDEPEEVILGQDYTMTIEETLFHYNILEPPAGTRTSTVTITPVQVEAVTIDGMEYEALRFDIEMSLLEVITEGSTLEAEATGTLWYGKGIGLLVSDLTITMTIGAESHVLHAVRTLSDADLEASSAALGSVSAEKRQESIPIQRFLKEILKMKHPGEGTGR